ncbi:glycosyl transferase family 2 [Terrabacter sp. Root85]|uniref:glycosyltransferase family 2 protein n=1 Tax=Terrabacter sp. Root85 TaxID=1736603 RepID=UPI000715B266|nr:glycosyltransferase family 2 protein [Terrabacter sp. Root85]KRC88256.1 glycosyl transferase family 2 [Terrabacter sp. Root85]
MNVYEVTEVAGRPASTVWQLAPQRHSLALVIPVINEGARLHRQLADIQASAPEVDVIVADGGSSDGSTNPAVLQRLGVTALLVKRGPGRLSAQLRMAFGYVLDADYLGVLTMDGNGKDGTDGIARMAGAIDSGLDFVQGSRFIPGGRAENTPLHRLLGIRLVHAPLTSFGARRRYTDTTNGFRGHSRALLTDPRVDVFRDVFDSYELLAYLPIRAARLGYRTGEVPVARSYPRSEPTPTKISGTSAHARLIRILWRAVIGDYDPGTRD